MKQNLIIGLLLGTIAYFLKEMKNSNKQQHQILFENHKELNNRLSSLEGQHGASFAVRGCAYDSDLLQGLVAGAVEEVLDKKTAKNGT